MMMLKRKREEVVQHPGKLFGEESVASVTSLNNPGKPPVVTNFRPILMAVKPPEVTNSGTFQKERIVLDSNLRPCSVITGGGTLADLINKIGGCGLPESTVSHLTRNILIGLNYIHSHGFVCSELRSENIFIVPTTTTEHNYIAKINFDFGMGKNTKGTEEIKGCVKYLAPEAVNYVDNYNNVELERGCDIWALGCIVLEMLTGKNMWDGIEDSGIEDLLCRIGNGHGFLKLSSEIISKDAQGFLKGCLEREAVYRLTAEKLLNHPFVAADGNVQEEISTAGGDMQEVMEEEGTDDLEFIPLELEESQEDGEALSEDDDFIQLEVEDLQEGSEAGYNDDDEAVAYFDELYYV